MNDLASYDARGFAGPFRLATSEKMESIVDTLEASVFKDQQPLSGHALYARYLDSPLVFRLCSDPVIVNVIRKIIGEDILLWSCGFIPKSPNQSEIPWHQDVHYWPLEPPVATSAWIALTDAFPENGCLQAVPGSHTRALSFVNTDHRSGFDKIADITETDSRSAVTLQMKAGEFVVFNERLVHRSLQNRTNQTRLALVARFTAPSVTLHQEQFPFFPGHAAVLVSGSDRFGLNVLANPPTEGHV